MRFDTEAYLRHDYRLIALRLYTYAVAITRMTAFTQNATPIGKCFALYFYAHFTQYFKAPPGLPYDTR
jgi:hypothetical protein